MTLTTKEKAIKIATLLDNKKANDIKILEVKELTIITDYFVICSADSTTQVKALTEHLEETMKLEGFKLFGIEGVSNARWILMDYGDVIVHIFWKKQDDIMILKDYGLMRHELLLRELPYIKAL